ncbi:MAG: hypothetical protein KKG14_01090 [Alphaproteobacteria bacterium]|nr:hypothetical protein [Alphaproteobacteria bacterium]MBU2272124.1 hypothetical protein [Alphaproteobacteria bacterium]MBU2417284.1 hypothetical protein [Alphaproteobacteria bacterium]
MTAVACLRVSLDANRTDIPVESLGPLVAKYTNAFLEVRWCWPRTYDLLTHYCYRLADPRTEELDTFELARLSDELELRLFGTAAADALTLLLFEGSEEAIREFSVLPDEGLTALMNGSRSLPDGGRLSRIAADGSLTRIPPGVVPRPPLTEAAPPPLEAVQGIYFPDRQMFVGDVVSCTPGDSELHVSVADGREHQPPDAVEFDNACLLSALRLFNRGGLKAPLYLPMSFSKLMRPTLRAGYAELLHVLPPSARAGLAAAIYDVPRVMSYQSLMAIQGALDDHVAAIDLQTADPCFEVLHLSPQAVRSVTFVLPDAGPEVRLAALRRFGGRAGEFRSRQIRTGATNIRTRKERLLARDLGVQFLTGPAICRLRAEPVGGRTWAFDNLPARDEDGDQNDSNSGLAARA